MTTYHACRHAVSTTPSMACRRESRPPTRARWSRPIFLALGIHAIHATDSELLETHPLVRDPKTLRTFPCFRPQLRRRGLSLRLSCSQPMIDRSQSPGGLNFHCSTTRSCCLLFGLSQLPEHKG